LPTLKRRFPSTSSSRIPRTAASFSFLLESVVGGERFGRYSFIGLPARTLVRASGFGADAGSPRW
jgi:anthranilate/para-aminobenzoate synthase component I